jgi:hypothetical protein
VLARDSKQMGLTLAALALVVPAARFLNRK